MDWWRWDSFYIPTPKVEGSLLSDMRCLSAENALGDLYLYIGVRFVKMFVEAM